MDANPASIAEVFSGEKQYVVPVFQRNYVWGPDKWQTLWKDLMSVMEEDDFNFNHFIGPMVVMAQVSPIDVPKFLVIDGQQRLMTLTILFSALRDKAKALGIDRIANAIDINTLFFVPITGDRREKVVPRIRDRDALEGILLRKRIIDPNHSVSKAYKYFYDEIEKLTPTQPSLFENRPPESVLEAIYSAVTQRLRAVVISLEKSDNPSNIYESLNFKSEKLQDSALIQNYVFMKLPSLDEQEKFDSAYWSPFEEKFSYAGNNKADEITDFYYRFLISKTEYFARARLYTSFTNFVDNFLKTKKLIELVAELSEYADFYIAIKHKSNDQEIETTMRRYRMLDVDTAIPLLLKLFYGYDVGLGEPPSKTGKIAFQRMVRLIESFILRRTILRERTRGYGELFAEACRKVTTQADLIAFFADRGWPTNEQVKDVIEDYKFYQREPKKTRLILTEIERSFGHKEVVNLENAQIEHVMPQELTHSWREMLGSDAESVHERRLHTLGNLTLTGYNVELGQRPFNEKKVRYEDSKLSLNKYFADVSEWKENEILERTQYLTKILLDIWDRPEGASQDTKGNVRNAWIN